MLGVYSDRPYVAVYQVEIEGYLAHEKMVAVNVKAKQLYMSSRP